VASLAHDKVTSYAAAQSVLDREVQRQNVTVCRTTGLGHMPALRRDRK
jgi:hypothetical protein